MFGETCHNCVKKDAKIMEQEIQIEHLLKEVEKKGHALDVLDERRMDYLTILNEVRSLKSELLTNNLRTKRKKSVEIVHKVHPPNKRHDSVFGSLLSGFSLHSMREWLMKQNYLNYINNNTKNQKR